tara:strand:- start:1 stop:294 length:294 start_codon:yes stop_codon:yes gene_type:complete
MLDKYKKRIHCTNQAKKLGAIMEVSKHSSGQIDIWIDAPEGKRFTATNCHVITCFDIWPDEVAEIWHYVYEDLSDGVYDCDEGECETCLDNQNFAGA